MPGCFQHFKSHMVCVSMTLMPRTVFKRNEFPRGDLVQIGMTVHFKGLAAPRLP